MNEDKTKREGRTTSGTRLVELPEDIPLSE